MCGHLMAQIIFHAAISLDKWSRHDGCDHSDGCAMAAPQKHGKHHQQPTRCLAVRHAKQLQPLHLGQKALYNDLLEIRLLPSTVNQSGQPKRLS